MYTRIPNEKEENMLRVRGQESWASTMLIGSSHNSSKGTSLGSRKSCSVTPRQLFTKQPMHRCSPIPHSFCPTAATCSNSLQLPRYMQESELQRYLLLAIAEDNIPFAGISSFQEHRTLTRVCLIFSPCSLTLSTYP